MRNKQIALNVAKLYKRSFADIGHSLPWGGFDAPMSGLSIWLCLLLEDTFLGLSSLKYVLMRRCFNRYYLLLINFSTFHAFLYEALYKRSVLCDDGFGGNDVQLKSVPQLFHIKTNFLEVKTTIQKSCLYWVFLSPKPQNCDCVAH